MKERYLIGLDIGTTLVKGGVYDSHGECVCACTKKAPEECPGPGVYIQSGEEFFTTVVEVLKNCVRGGSFAPDRVEAIGFSGQMGGAIGVDRDWRPVTEWSNGLDTRYVPYTSRMSRIDAEGMLTFSGTSFSYFAPKIL
jgi:xylulokinase